MNYNQPKTETSVSIETENKRTEIFNQSKQFFLKVFWSDVYKEMEDIDEVDGKIENFLQPIVKLYFIKIILIDIGISFGDVATDTLHGLNLIFDENWNVQWHTYHYGLIVLGKPYNNN